MTVVRAKKNLGQHFLTDLNIARNIVGSLTASSTKVLEIGPGMGVLTQYLFQSESFETIALDIDRESIDFLKKKFPQFANQIVYGDFLKSDLAQLVGEGSFSIIGNFPYNISSQILFKVLDHRNQVDEVVCMLQKEVAQRLASKSGCKEYGILSVLLQAFYSIDYLFTVQEHVFDPPPKVKSAVIRLKRNDVQQLPCDEVLFKKLIKAGFSQRRKMLRNSIKPFIKDQGFSHPFLEKRPEQLSVDDFIELTVLVSNQ
jgi:16S rRNA (adenine1518-N6/adenine1519-N6)-dimethyltransferase